MSRIGHARLDQLRQCKQPMSWMNDEEVIGVLAELWDSRDALGKLQERDASIAWLMAEVDRLLDGNAVMLSRNIDLDKQLGERDKQLAERTQQLAAAEAISDRMKVADRIIASNGRLCFGVVELSAPVCSEHWEVENTTTGEVLGEEDDDGEFEARLFSDWYEAYQAAVAAGWLPQTTGEG